jgi:hypothetical protein
MKIGMVNVVIGIVMFATGLVLFYSIELGQTNDVLRFIKNVGTFVGLSGMGVTLAGVLLYLINKKEPPIKENLDI